MKTFPLKIEEQLHRLIKHAAIEEDTSVHSWILDAIKVKLHQDFNLIKEESAGYGSNAAKSTRSRQE